MLVDSDVLIWYLRGLPKAAQFLDTLPAIRLSAVSYMELVQGMRSKREIDALKADLDQRHAGILPITETISARAVSLVEAHFHGHALQLADALIAATALKHGLTLATANDKHYRVVDNLQINVFRPEQPGS
jgi:predicted nucleic acid-binding protein